MKTRREIVGPVLPPRRNNAERDLVTVADWLRRRAMERVYDGSPEAKDYARTCSIKDISKNLLIIFSRNADQFWHLAIGDLDGKRRDIVDFKEWVEAFYKIHVPLVLFEEERDGYDKWVYHWWLCCDHDWRPCSHADWQEMHTMIELTAQ